MGSKISNIKFDSEKQKLVLCIVCQKEVVVGKFAKVNQQCNECKGGVVVKLPRKTDAKGKKTEAQSSFATQLSTLAKQLDFEIAGGRQWKKRYPIDGGSIATVYIMVGPGVAGEQPKVEYFSMTIQRAIGVTENFRDFMPEEAASDCEVIAAELGNEEVHKPQVGVNKCDVCGETTDEYGVDTNKSRILCIVPNGCFKKNFGMSSAEAAV